MGVKLGGKGMLRYLRFKQMYMEKGSKRTTVFFKLIRVANEQMVAVKKTQSMQKEKRIFSRRQLT